MKEKVIDLETTYESAIAASAVAELTAVVAAAAANNLSSRPYLLAAKTCFCLRVLNLHEFCQRCQ